MLHWRLCCAHTCYSKAGWALCDHPLLQVPKSQFGQLSHLSSLYPVQGPNCNRRGWASQAPPFWCWSQAETGLGEHLNPIVPVQQAGCNHAGKTIPWTPPFLWESETTTGLVKSPESRPHNIAAKPPSAQIGVWSSSHKWLNHNRSIQATQTCPFHTMAEPQQQTWFLSSPGSSHGHTTAGEFM